MIVFLNCDSPTQPNPPRLASDSAHPNQPAPGQPHPSSDAADEDAPAAEESLAGQVPCNACRTRAADRFAERTLFGLMNLCEDCYWQYHAALTYATARLNAGTLEGAKPDNVKTNDVKPDNAKPDNAKPDIDRRCA